MRSKEFIIENDWGRQSISDEEWSTKVKEIQTNCKPYLQAAKGYNLFRGMGKAQEFFYEKEVYLEDRKPVDMPQIVHDKLNLYFDAKYGEPFRNALFVTGDDSIATEYGTLYRIYPMGQIEYLWSPKVFDLFSEWDEYQFVANKNGDMKKSLRKFHDEVLKNNGYTTSNLSAAIASKNEIMMRCSGYYAIKEDVFDYLTPEQEKLFP